MGKVYERVSAAELYRVQKPDGHWDILRRTKPFVAEDFLPPFDLPNDEALRTIITSSNDLASPETTESLVAALPHVNHDQVVHLALYLAFTAKLNTLEVWRAIEDAALGSLHLLSIKQIA